MAKLIIFDIGGVLVDFTEEMYIKYICDKLGLNKREFGRAMLSMLEREESGKFKNNEMLKILSRRFGVSVPSLEWAQSLRKLAKLNMNVIRLANRLNRNHTVVLLSNISRTRYLHNRDMDFYKVIRHKRIFASCFIKMAKPDPRIYRYVLRKMHTKPQDAIFIDNMIENVRGARKVGIRSIQYTSYPKLVRDLKKEGIRW